MFLSLLASLIHPKQIDMRNGPIQLLLSEIELRLSYYVGVVDEEAADAAGPLLPPQITPSKNLYPALN